LQLLLVAVEEVLLALPLGLLVVREEGVLEPAQVLGAPEHLVKVLLEVMGLQMVQHMQGVAEVAVHQP